MSGSMKLADAFWRGSSALRPWVKFFVDCPQSFLIDMGIYLGRCDIDMAEHFLHAS